METRPVVSHPPNIVVPLALAGAALFGFAARWLIYALARRRRIYQVVRSIDILRPRHELFRFLRNLEGMAVVEEELDRRISWRMSDRPGLDVDTTVSLRDAENGRGTQVTVALHGLSRDVESQLAADLIRLRQILETGEVATGKHRRGAAIQAVSPRRI